MDEMVNEDWKRIVRGDDVYYLNIHTNERRAFLIEEMPEDARNETPWNELFDEKTGNPYYWNSETNETTWEMPPELDEICKAEEQFYLKQLYKHSSELNLKVKDHCNGWQEIYQSKESALKFGSDEPICFYYNKNTQTLQYGTPVDVVSMLLVMTRLQRSNMNVSTCRKYLFIRYVTSKNCVAKNYNQHGMESNYWQK